MSDEQKRIGDHDDERHNDNESNLGDDVEAHGIENDDDTESSAFDVNLGP
ncbi:hypothetical protein ACFWF7_14455 [Nocardia sp. NPDC060256]